MTFYTIKMNHKKLKQRASYETEVKVFRSASKEKAKHETKMINSTQLVPGDLIEIPNNKKLPCDIVILNGTFY